MTPSSPDTSWYMLLQGLVSLTKPATEAVRQTVLDQMIDLVSDPSLAEKVISVATRPESHLLQTAPELYWAAQLTLAGGSGTVH